MVGGIVLIIAGILISIYPPLLSLIMATLLILLGIMQIAVAHYHRKLRTRNENPAIELLFRF